MSLSGAYCCCISGCRLLICPVFRNRIFALSSSWVQRHQVCKLYTRVLPLCSRFDKSKSTKQKTSGKKQKEDVNSLFRPVPFKPNPLDIVGEGSEIAGKLQKDEVLKVLSLFFRKPEIKILAAENGLDQKLFYQVFASFRKFCSEVDSLPVDLHVILKDITQDAGHPDDLFPYFLEHAREIFPHMTCMEDLKKISDLRSPANWYPEARSIERKIIFHAGPTNSGKTYHALQRFFEAKSGIYCGPLKLLANEVFQKSKVAGTPCDLITGEERKYYDANDIPSAHLACTIEMAATNTRYEVAVIDEIQMIRDQQRGWAWTRALLGLYADEVHICGEGSAIDTVKELMIDTGDDVEVRRYKRLTKLKYLDAALGSIESIRPGDCMVCFSKNEIYKYSQALEKRGIQCAVIYGHLPPGTKLAQAAKFNDPNDPCKVMLATDAIGMGLNLSIKRIIFNTLIKPQQNDKGEKEMDVITTSQALQIGGRAGRFGTDFAEGEVTTYRRDDIKLLHEIITKPVELITQAGLHPTADQIELFSYHLPNATLSNLINIFETICQLDSDKFFMCNMEDFKFLADMIEHVPLPLRVRYVFCLAPITKQDPFVCTTFLKFARQVSRGEPLKFNWLCKQIDWPFKHPNTLAELLHLEMVHDCLDLYLWLSYRFSDMFPDVFQVRDIQQELDLVIQQGVLNITKLLQNTGKNKSVKVESDINENGPLSNSVIKEHIVSDLFESELVDDDVDDNSYDIEEKVGHIKGKRIKQISQIKDQSIRQEIDNEQISDENDLEDYDNGSIDTGDSDDEEGEHIEARGKFYDLNSKNKIANSRFTSFGDLMKQSISKGNTSTKENEQFGRLTSELLRKGVLTPDMLERLKKELLEGDSSREKPYINTEQKYEKLANNKKVLTLDQVGKYFVKKLRKKKS